MRTIKTFIVGLTLVAPSAAALAQPAPIHNPVVARMPCALSVGHARTNSTEGKSMRVRYEPGNKYDVRTYPAGESGRGEWSRDVGREIGLGLRGACD